MASTHCDDEETFAPAAVNPFREDSMQDILLSPPPSSAGSEHSDFSRKSHGRDDTPELVYDSQQSNESELFSSQEQIDPSGNQITLVGSSRSPRREDLSSQEEVDPLCNDYFIGIASPASQPLEDLEHLIRLESTTERKGRKLRPIEEVCSDDEGKESESVDDPEGSSASSQESLSREMGRLTAGPDSTNYSEINVEDGLPGQTSRASSSPGPSRKRKASNELTSNKEKSPRKLLESLALPTLSDTEKGINAQVDIGVAEDHKPTSSSPITMTQIATVQPSDLADAGYLTPEQDKSQGEQTLENTTLAGFPTHGVRGSEKSDIPGAVISSLEVAQPIRAASEPPYIHSDDQHLTLDDNQEEQENTTGFPTNSVHSSQSSDIPAIVSSLAVVQHIRAASEPCYTRSTFPNIQAGSKRRVNMDSVAELAKRHLVGGTVELIRTKRKSIRNRTINPLPRLRPRMVETKGHGPQLYEATTVASSVIYWPEEIGGESEHGFSAEPTPSAGLEELPTHLPNGGTILSVHQPTTTLAWLEENYDYPILKSMRRSCTFSGPLAMMLFPDTPALAIFGPCTPSRARLAQKLANKCRAPVIARSSEDDPMIRIKSLLPQSEFNGAGKIQSTDKLLSAIPLPVPDPVVVMGAAVRNTTRGDGSSKNGITSFSNDSGDRDDSRRRHPAQPPTNESPTAGSSGRNLGAVQRGIDANDGSERSENSDSTSSRGETNTAVSDADMAYIGIEKQVKEDDYPDPGDGGNDPATSEDKWEDWFSAHHTSTMEIHLQGKNMHQVDISRQTQFKTYADERLPADPSSEWTKTRSQAQAHTRLNLWVNPNRVILDRSYAVLGLQGHRPFSIIRHENLDCGFSEPTQTYKRVVAKNVQNTFGGTVGFTGVHPLPTVKATYAHGQGTTDSLEAADSKPPPPYDIRSSPGESYLAEADKSYKSWNYSYVPRGNFKFDPDTENQLQPLPDTEFAYGVNFNRYNTEKELEPPPQVSYINRNEIFLWFVDPSLRSKMQGTVLLLSDYIKDIRTRSVLDTIDKCIIDLATGETIQTVSKLARDKKDGAISLDVIAVDQKKYTPEALPKPPSKLKRLQTQAVRTVHKMNWRQPSHQVTLVARESVSRGWDTTSCQWREAIYSELDKHFRAPTSADSSLVAYKISPYELPASRVEAKDTPTPAL
ncbi:hypothetical protein B0H11DRAFT_1988244 [Mycena galericulata]|nr:hypothetical protein B0H11DRAFT_1988244 [Mycena galericulata]